MSTHACLGAFARPGRALGHFRTLSHGRLRACALRAAATGIAIFLCGVPPAQSEPAPPYAALLQESQTMAPRLLEAEANRRAAEGRSNQAGLLPNPTVNFYSENLGSNAVSGFSAPQYTLSLSEPIELGGKRGARIASGLADVRTAESEARLARVQFAYELAIDYVAAEAAQARIALYELALQAATDDLRAAQALVNAGREAELRAVQAGSALAAAQSDLETVRSEFQISLAALSALVASPRPFSAVPASLLPMAGRLGQPPSGAPAQFPAVAVAEAERQAAAQRVAVERTRPAPTVTATLGLRRIDGTNSTLIVGGLGVPLPLFDDNSGNISAAVAELDAADQRLRAARATAESGWAAALNEVSAAESRVAASQQAETAADSAYRLSRTGYDAGRTPLIEVLTARRNLTDAQLRSVDAAVARIRAEANLGRLSGRGSFGGAP